MTKRLLAVLLVCVLAMTAMTACNNTETETGGTTTTTTAAGGDGTTTTTDDGIFDLGDDVFGTTTAASQDGETEDGTTTAASQNGDTTTAGKTTAGKTTAGKTTAGKTTTNKNDSGKKTTKTTKNTTKVQTQPSYSQVEDLSDLKDYEKDVYKKLPELKVDKEKKVVVLATSAASATPMMGRKYGLTVETVIVSPAELITKYITMVNKEEPPDVMIGNYNYTLISKGYVQAWDSYVDLTKSMWKAEKKVMDNFAVSKKHYLFVPKSHEGGAHLMYVVYNTGLMNEAGVTAPATLFAQNKWDWDAMIDTVDKLVGQGKSGAWLYNGPQAFVNSTGHDYVDFVNGRATNMLKNADVTRSIQAYSDLVAKKGVYTGNDAIDRLKAGSLGMIVGTQGTVMALEEEILKGKVDVTAFPRDPKKNEHYMPYMGNGFYLAKGAKHPNNAVAWMTCWHYEQDNDYRAAVNKDLQDRDAGGTPVKIFDKLRNIDEKVGGTMQTWDLFGSEAAVYISALGPALNAGSPWSLLSSELGPILNDGIRTFYGG